MSLTDSTLKQQEILADYCRTGSLTDDLEGITPGRISHYRRLVRGVYQDALYQAYPLTHKLLGDERFTALIDEFFANHSCQEEQIYKMTRELLDYMNVNPSHELIDRHPFLLDLLRFEWVEMEMYMMEDLELPNTRKSGDWEQDVVALNPEHRLLAFKYPVFSKKVDELPTIESGDCYCLAHRNLETGSVVFSEVSPLFVVIIEQIMVGHSIATILALLKESGIEITTAQSDQIIQYLQSQQETGLVLGFLAN